MKVPDPQNIRYRGYLQREGERGRWGEYRELQFISLVLLGGDVTLVEGIDIVKEGVGTCTPTLRKLGRKYDHYWMYARKSISCPLYSAVCG